MGGDFLVTLRADTAFNHLQCFKAMGLQKGQKRRNPKLFSRLGPGQRSTDNQIRPLPFRHFSLHAGNSHHQRLHLGHKLFSGQLGPCLRIGVNFQLGHILNFNDLQSETFDDRNHFPGRNKADIMTTAL
ncbi:hypothetical protein SDC9_178572 [bioreactor metagenome]|uniref:Uncharacterized protein n=1 Tax=bioreactor metagenome TaxID=1076179 RepID=A0A645GWJ7_9ZZZZ